MGLGIGSRVRYKHGCEAETGIITAVSKMTSEMYVEWDDEIDNGWFYEYDLVAL